MSQQITNLNDKRNQLISESLIRQHCQFESLEVNPSGIQLVSTSAVDEELYSTNEIENMSFLFNARGSAAENQSSGAFFQQLELIIQEISEATHISYEPEIQTNNHKRNNPTNLQGMRKLKRSRTGSHECIICFSRIKKNVKIPHLKCNHKFHRKCLQRWVDCKPNCPLCRSKIV